MYKWRLVLIYLYKDYTTFKRVCIEIFFHILAHYVHFILRHIFLFAQKLQKDIFEYLFLYKFAKKLNSFTRTHK